LKVSHDEAVNRWEHSREETAAQPFEISLGTISDGEVKKWEHSRDEQPPILSKSHLIVSLMEDKETRA